MEFVFVLAYGRHKTPHNSARNFVIKMWLILTFRRSLVLAKWSYLKICSSHDGATVCHFFDMLPNKSRCHFPIGHFFQRFYSRTHTLCFRLCVSRREIKGFYISWPVCYLILCDTQAKWFKHQWFKLHPRAGQRVKRKLKRLSKLAPWVGSHSLKLADPNLDWKYQRK